MLKSLHRYGYLTPVVRGKKSFLLTKSDYDAMLSAENVQAAVRRLEGTRYRSFAIKILMEEFNVLKIEEELMKNYYDDLNFIISNLKNRDAIDFFNELHYSLEHKCLISILKSIILDVALEKTTQYVFPYGKIDASTCKTLIESKDVSKVLKLIEKPLAADIDKILKEIDEPLLKSLEIEAAINKNDAMKTWDRVNRLKGRDKRCIKIIGITYDITNIMIVLRLKKLGFKSDIIRRNLIPIYHELTEGELIKAIEAPTDRDAIKIFAAGYYVGVISPLMSTYEVKEELTIFETAFKRFHSNECEKTFVFQPFNLGEPLAYLYLKLYEIRDLVAILAGKYSKLSAERIAPILILHQPPHPI